MFAMQLSIDTDENWSHNSAKLTFPDAELEASVTCDMIFNHFITNLKIKGWRSTLDKHSR